MIATPHATVVASPVASARSSWVADAAGLVLNAKKPRALTHRGHFDTSPL